MIKRPAGRADAVKVSISPSESDVAPPPTLPPTLPTLPPATAGWRWPWLLATLALTAAAGTLWLHTIPRVFQFLGTSDGGDYTEWVYSPLTWAYFLAAVLGVITAILLGVPPWRQRTRLLIFALFVLLSLTTVIRAAHESTARRHVARQLVAAVDAFPSPVGATSSGPAVVGSDGAFAPVDVLGEPSASRSWQLPANSAAATCAAVNQMIAGERDWKADPGWPCGFSRLTGRVFVRLYDNQLGSKADQIDVLALPTDGANY